MGTLGRATRNGKKMAARRVELRERSHPAVAKLAVALKEHKEALEQQAATAEILRALSRSSGDPQPIFTAIVEKAHRLCGAVYSILYRYDGERVTVAATSRFSAPGAAVARRLYPAAPRRDHIVGRAILEGRPLHSADLPNDARFPVHRNDAFSKVVRRRAVLAVPLLRNGSVIGAISVGRAEARAFSKKEIWLLQTFADQAVIAIENVRLFNETKEALEQQTATSEILRVISNSPTEIQPVLDAVAATAARLCEARDAVIQLREGDVLRFAAHYGTIPQLPPGGTRAISRHFVTGRAVLEGRQIHVHDLQAEKKEFPQGSAVAKEFGYRTMLVTPLMREGKAIGTILIRRTEVRPFSAKHLALVRTFADQAVIAIENVRLFNETKEALEHQKASADILRVVAGSIENTDPVFEAITRAGMRLIPGSRVSLILVREGQLHYVSHSGIAEERRSELAKHFPLPLDRQTVAGTTILDKRMIHVPDFAAEGKDFPVTRKVFSKISGFRAMLAVPLVRKRKVIGAINVSRETPGPFSDKQIALANTFADQAVIAIQNAQMFREIQDRNAELKQALDFQGASGEILSSISTSVADAQPVFDAIVESVRRLFSTSYAVASLIRGDRLELVAASGDESYLQNVRAAYPWPLEGEDSTLAARAVSAGQVIQVCPIEGNPDAPARVRRLAKASGYDSVVMVPMMREGETIGLIVTARSKAIRFDDKEVALLKAFADQAVIAIQNAKMFREIQDRNAELKQSLDFQGASGEILASISSSITDAQPVFDAIVRSLLRLFGTRFATVALLRDGKLQLTALHGEKGYDWLKETYPQPLSDWNLTGRAILSGQVLQLTPCIGNPAAPPRTVEVATKVGFNSIIAAPMIREGKVIGSITTARREAVPFDEKQVALIKAFADQAVIAIENARLFNETKEALEYQKASAEVLEVISGSVADTRPVYDKILDSCLRLFEGHDVGVALQGEDGMLHMGAWHGTGEKLLREKVFPMPLDRDSAAGVAMLERRVMHYPDIERGDGVPPKMRASTHLTHIKSAVIAPMLWEGKAIGSLYVGRQHLRPFSDKEIALVKTFADQAVIAIQNARLFNETREALERQTATSEILKVISASPTDVQPVFDAIVQSAVRLFEPCNAGILMLENDQIHVRSAKTPSGPGVDEAALAKLFPMPIERSFGIGAAIRQRKMVEIVDTEATGTPEEALAISRAFRTRSVTLVPLMREGEAIGEIAIASPVPGQRLNEKQIALLQTFADQAVIAIENVRLFTELQTSNRELTTALDTQTATSDILRVISRSQADVQPVFDAIVHSAVRLLRGYSGALSRVSGDEIVLTANTSTDETGDAATKAVFPQPLRSEFPHAQAIRAGTPFNVADAQTDGRLLEDARAYAHVRGYRSWIVVPMLRQNEAIGAIGVTRREAGGFTDDEIALLQTFADQAVIAIENVRLFNETKESLERQTATAEILQVIASSPSSVQPVFETICKSAAQLCDAKDAVLWRVDGEALRVGGHFGDLPVEEIPIAGSAPGRAAADGEVVHVLDLQAETVRFPVGAERASRLGLRTTVSVPLMREGKAIGVITARRAEIQAFSDKQIALLKTFADQAVIAIENVRLFNETKEALERQTATAEILGVLGGSMSDPQPVFDAIVKNCHRLFEGSGVALRLIGEDARLHVKANVGYPAEPVPIDRTSAVGTCVLDGGSIHFPDLDEAAKRFPRIRQLGLKHGYRSGIYAALMRGGKAIGAMSVMRRARRAFDDREIQLLNTFTEQAVIAIENARLFNETKEALERQTATAGILRVMSGSPDSVQPVFSAILEHALQLCEASFGYVCTCEGNAFNVVMQRGLEGEVLAAATKAFNETRVVGPDTALGRLRTRLLPIHIPDAREEDAYRSRDPRRVAIVELAGARTMLAVPLLREGTLIGAVLAYRREVKPFTDKQIALLQTFADQAVIAIENVRLFNETKESLEQQTATAEILKVISSSPTATQPVFEAIVQSAARLFPPCNVAIVMREGELIHRKANAGPRVSQIDQERLAKFYPLPFDPKRSVVARAMIERRIIEIPDTEAQGLPEILAPIARASGYRSLTAVPLIREGEGIGTIGLSHPEPGFRLAEKQLSLVRTFAAQAVIAIENVRLFNETKESLEQQTAIGEVLRVISGSPTDVKPILEAVAMRAARICDASDARIFLVESVNLRHAAGFGDVPMVVPLGDTMPLNRGSAMGRAVIDRTPIHLEDIRAESADEYPQARKIADQSGWRTVLAVPLMREDRSLGVIALRRMQVRPFNEKQIALLKTFADQAAIAIENVRLFNETKEALERQTATADILKVISSSPTNVQPVFDAIVASALRLFAPCNAGIWMLEGDQVVLRGAKRVTEGPGVDHEAVARLFPRPIEDSFAIGKAILERRIVNVPDTERADFLPSALEISRTFGIRSCIFVPLMREDAAIGVIGLASPAPGLKLSDKQVALLRTFADQAVIAIENVRLFKELQARTEALTKSVGQLTALGEVGQAISSTLDLETVLKTIVARAVQLTGLDGGSIYEYDERAEEYHLRASENFSEEIVEALRRTPIRRGEGPVWRAGVTGQPTEIPEMLDESYQTPRREFLVRAGYRALLVVPLLRENHIIGALAVSRKAPGGFAPEVVELLKTFATQSAMAIQNARLFREIAEKGKQLEVASRHKSDFLASMSHELRTPLNALLGFNEMILGDIYGEVPSDMKPPLAQMQSSGKHLLRLINNVLDLAKIEAGRMELALSDYSVHDTVESVRSTLRPLAADKGLEFLAAVQAEIPLAYGDPGRITQCLMNLAGNSLKFTKAGKVEISAALNDGWLRYRVADTGIGIPPEKLGSLFTEFKQTDATIASEYGGTGLGLSISKKFVELHGGRIWVESEPGKGSVFTFEIPLRAKTA